MTKTISKDERLKRMEENDKEWQRHCEQEASYKAAFLATCKQLWDRGEEYGLWRAIIFYDDECNDWGTEDWIRDGVVAYAHNRHGGKRTKSRDLAIFETVNYWRTQERTFGKKNKSRRLSLDECFEITRKTLDGHGIDLSLEAIKKIYQRCVKRYPALIGKVARS